MNKNLVTLFILSLVLSCAKEDNTPKEELPIVPSDEIITIPIVVHVINYTPDPFVISDEKIDSQIAVLNKDFRKLNADHLNTPDEFKHLVADVGIQFKLATIDPNGNATTGIIRTEGSLIAGDGQEEGRTIEERILYFTNKRGQDAWPNSKYLNIWIADSSDRFGNLGLPGYANPPGSDPRIDGVVMDPRVFGTLEPLAVNHEFGRTATHEIGHWLGLSHIFAGEDNCNSSDLVEDTPTQFGSYSGHPTHPQGSCGSNDMFMNFMDYVADDAMYMFTIGQKKRMRALFNEGGLRRELYLNNKIE
ncbi:MAG: zinc metalloprotease [Cellulophaga sp.]